MSTTQNMIEATPEQQIFMQLLFEPLLHSPHLAIPKPNCFVTRDSCARRRHRTKGVR